MKYVYGKRMRTFKDRLTTLFASLIILANTAGAAVPFVLAQRVAAASPTTQVVLQSDFANTLNTWTYHYDNSPEFADPSPTANHEVVANPAPATNDSGAVRLVSADGDRWNLASLQYSGTKLADIEALGFSVYTNAPGKAYINLDVDFNHPGLNGWQGRLVYVPSGVTSNTWSSHEAVASNNQWGWSRMIAGPETEWPDGGTSSLRSWNDIIAAFPEARITAIDNVAFGSLYLRADGVSTTYYDHVYLATATQNVKYNFELPHPDPLGKHQMSVSGNVHRDHSLNHCSNKTTCEDHAENLDEGWVINMYKDNAGVWEFVKSTQTNSSGNFIFSAVKDAGKYHVCEVVKAGWTQQTQNWSGTPYHIATANLSGNATEGPYCRTINYPDTGNYSNKFYFGNVDTKKPSTEVLGPVAGIGNINGGAYNSNFDVDIRTTDNESGIVQAIANLYGPSGLIGSCVNQTVSPAAALHDYTCNVNVASLSDGAYYLKINSKDATGNTSNTVTWNFTVDKTAPEMPVHEYPDDNAFLNFNDFWFEWSDVSDAVGYEVQYSQNPATGADGSFQNVMWTGDYQNIQPTDSKARSVGADGTWYWQVRAVDEAGNKSAWTTPWKLTIDMVTPQILGITYSESPSNTEKNSGDTTYLQNFIFSLTSDSDTVRYRLKYWNDISGSPFKELSPWNPMDNSWSGHMGPLGTYTDLFTQGYGTHYFSFSACDAANNCSEYSEPFEIVYAVEPPAPAPAAITKPVESHVMNAGTTLELEANDEAAGGSPVQWAVRLGTCSANTGTVAGNVDGFDDTYDWINGLFTANLETAGWVPGIYCFVFNPAGETRLTRNFSVGASQGISTDTPNSTDTQRNNNNNQQDVLGSNTDGTANGDSNGTGGGGGGSQVLGLANTGQVASLGSIAGALILAGALIISHRRVQK